MSGLFSKTYFWGRAFDARFPAVFAILARRLLPLLSGQIRTAHKPQTALECTADVTSNPCPQALSKPFDSHTRLATAAEGFIG